MPTKLDLDSQLNKNGATRRGSSRSAELDQVVYPKNRRLRVRAQCLAERIELGGIAGPDHRSADPVVQEHGDGGLAIVFRYGAVVTFEPSSTTAADLPRSISGRLSGAFTHPDVEGTTLHVDSTRPEGTAEDGSIVVHRATLGSLLVVAEVLGKSIALAHHEEKVRAVLERADPLADQLRRRGAMMGSDRELVTLLGSATLTQLRTAGRVAVRDKPEAAWERPELDRLYERLRRDHELSERDAILTQKLGHITQTTNMFVTLIQGRRTHRVEWYIVLLIVVEIVILVYEMFLHG